MICLDSSFIIDFIRNDKAAVNTLNSLKDDAFVTTGINVFEVLFGVCMRGRRDDVKAVKEFFNNLVIFNLDYKSANIASKIGVELSRDGRIIELNDILIGGIILANGCNNILTKNKEYFSRIRGLNIIEY